MKPKEEQFIFTDTINYSKTADASVWGVEDRATVRLLKQSKLSGSWLNLCAGDGRFNNLLLTKVEHVTALDIDPAPLKKLVKITPDKLKKKLSTQVANVVKRLPFADNQFDGIFCVGTLHLFPTAVFQRIVKEMGRVLKADGTIIIDFATDIRRRFDDGSLWVVKNEPCYTLRTATALLKKVFKPYRIKIAVDVVEPEEVVLNRKKHYVFTSNFILLKAERGTGSNGARSMLRKKNTK